MQVFSFQEVLIKSIFDHYKLMPHKVVSIVFLALFLVLILTGEWTYAGIAIALYISITFLGVANMNWNYFQKNYTQPKIKGNFVALTFDDGPTEITPKFLQLLEKYNQKATFFCIGKQIEKYPEIFKRIIAQGHQIGNHSYSHSNKTGFLNTKQMITEIEKNDAAILEITQIKTELYRPPFGITNPNIAKAIEKTHKKSIGWNIRPFDTATNNEEKILKRILPKVKPGSIILLHDTTDKSLHVLEQLLVFLHRENYHSLTISEMFDLSSNNAKT